MSLLLFLTFSVIDTTAMICFYPWNGSDTHVGFASPSTPTNQFSDTG